MLNQPCRNSCHVKRYLDPHAKPSQWFDQPCHHTCFFILKTSKRLCSTPDMQTARSVAAKRELLIRLIRLSMSDVVLEVEVLGKCLGRGQVNYNWPDIRSVDGRTLYQLQRFECVLFLQQAVSPEDTSIVEPFYSTRHVDCLPQTMGARQD